MRSGSTLWGVVSAVGVFGGEGGSTVGTGGAGKAMDAAGESEIRKFWTALDTESWLLRTESPASLIRQ